MDLGLSIGGGGEPSKRGVGPDQFASSSGRDGVRVGKETRSHPSLQLELKLSWPNELENRHLRAARTPTPTPTRGGGFDGGGRLTNPANDRGDNHEAVGPSPSTSRSTTAERANCCRYSDEEDGGGDGTPRKKLRLTKEQSCYLEESFREHTTLNPKQKLAIAKNLNLRPRQVEVWFQNRRARTKLKQTEVDYEYLKRCCDSLTQENRRLHKELQELRALKSLNPHYRLHLPAATTLIMCPSCERAVAATNNHTTTTTVIAKKLTSTSSSSSFDIPLKLRDSYPKLAYQVS